MNSLRMEMFSAARAYHAAVAVYCRVLSNRDDLEDPAQQVLGASLRYRVAIDRLIASTPDHASNHRRLYALRARLHRVSREYNTVQGARSFKREGRRRLDVAA